MTQTTDPSIVLIGMRSVACLLVAACCAAVAPSVAGSARSGPAASFAVGYRSVADLRRAIAGRGVVVQRLSRLRVAEVRSSAPRFAETVRGRPGVTSVQRTRLRTDTSEPALLPQPGLAIPYEWQFGATHADGVPAAVLRAAANVTIAVIDTGADLTAPDLAAKQPQGFDVATGSADVRDLNGHGTFVSSLAAGSVTNGDGIAGFGGDAHLLVVRAASPSGSLTDIDETTAILYAVDHGARVINLSVGGPSTSLVERRGIAYAAEHGVLVVAAAGNEFTLGNPVEYPAALLQPIGSNGRGGVGLSVGASTADGTRAFFSNTGSQLSLAAPGEDVFGDVSSFASPALFPRSPLPGSAAGSYGFGSGTSFAAPEVSGAAALVFAANPFLSAADVAAILKSSASGHGAWNPQLGFGVLDVAAAVALATSKPGIHVSGVRVGRRARLAWTATTAGPFRVSESVDGRRSKVLLASTAHTSASFSVRPRHRYRFTIAALDATGKVAASASLTVEG